jgi:putative membrane protein
MLVPITVAIALVAFLISISLFFWSGSPQSFIGPPFYRWGFGFPFLGWIFLIPLVFLVFFPLRWLFWGPWCPGRFWSDGYDDSALDILRQRFARGEITKEQLEEMQRDLE